MADTKTYEPRLKSEYRSRIRAAMKEKFGYTNEMQIPKLDKIVVNMGIGDAIKIQAVKNQMQFTPREIHSSSRRRTSRT